MPVDRAASPVRLAARRTVFALFAALALLLFFGAAAAQQDATMYEATAAVADRGSESRVRALRQALEQILTRVSPDGGGNTDSLLATPEAYVSQYRYELGGANQPGLRLWARFDAAAVQDAIRERGLPVWGAQRPTVLVWLAVEEGATRRYLLAEEDAGTVAGALRAAAARHGVPLLLPLMDLQDQSAVQFSDVWGDFVAPVSAASRRYAAPAMLMGRLRAFEAGGWRGEWMLRATGGDTRWNNDGADPATVLDQGLAAVADRLSEHLSVGQSGFGGSAVELQVNGVHTAADYARAQQFLSGMSEVSSVWPGSVRADHVRFRVELRGGVQAFTRALEVGSVLAPSGGAMEYYLRP